MIDQFDGDIAFIATPDGGQIIYTGGQPAMDVGGLENAVNISLFTGLEWWGNALEENEPDKQIGSDFEERAKPKAINTACLREIENAARDDLQWMINQKVAQSIKAVATWPETNRVDLAILITKPDGETVTVRYALNWEAGLLYPVTAKPIPSPTLDFDGKLKFYNKKGSFTINNTITGAESGATATIVLIKEDDTDVIEYTTGILYLINISGTFQDGEIIYESLGSELFTDNPSFETGGTSGDFDGGAEADDGTSDNFTDWIEFNVNDGNGDKVEATATKYAGAYALKLTKTTTAWVGVVSSLGGITVEPGNEYKLSFYGRGDGSQVGYYGIYDRSNLSYIVSIRQGTGAETDYIEKVKVFTAPAGCTAIDITFRVYNSGTAYFDAVSVKRIINNALADGTVY